MPNDVSEAKETLPIALDRAIRTMREAKPPEDMTNRVMASLGPLLGPSGSSDGGIDSPMQPPSALGGASMMGKGLIASAIVLAVGIPVWLAWPTSTIDPTPTDSMLVSTPPEREEETKEPTKEAEEIQESQEPSSVASSAKPNKAPKESGKAKENMPSEADLLGQARRLLDDNPKEARRLLLQHKALYPTGMLSQEREVMLIAANQKLGREKEAQEAADNFLKEHPGSAHGTKVRETTGKNH